MPKRLDTVVFLANVLCLAIKNLYVAISIFYELKESQIELLYN